MFDHSPSDRVQLRSIGELRSPGCCTLCGNGTNEKGYVDIGSFLEFIGTFYLCADPCAMQIAELIGYLTPGEAEHIKLVSEEIAKENTELKDRLNVLTERTSVIDDLIAGALSSGAIPYPIGPQPEGVDGSNPSTSDGSDERKPVAKKSVASRRSHDASQSTVRDERKIDL